MKKILLSIALFVLFGVCSGQTVPVNIAQIVTDATPLTHKFLWDRGSSFPQQNSLFNEIDLSSYELLSANLSFSDKDQTQKIVLAPFRLTNDPVRWGQLTNTKLNFALKDNITTLGFAFGGDNTAPYTRRSVQIRARVFSDLPVPGIPAGVTTFEDYLLTALSDCGDNCLSPERLDSLKEFYHKKKLQEVFENYNRTELQRANDSIQKFLLKYDKLVARHVWKWSLGYNIQLFPNLFAQGTVNDFDSLNHFDLKSHNFSATVTYAFSNNLVVLTGAYNQIYARTTAEETQGVVPYYGPAFTASCRIWSFFKQEQLDTMASYRKNLFVPSLNIGLGVEARYADAASKYYKYYKDGIQNTVVWTPFFDILINPALQFRVALPITQVEYLNKEKTMYAGAVIHYSFKLSNLAQ